MPERTNHFLDELTIWKLKAIASEYGVDVSECRFKRDYVQRLSAKNITEEQARIALDKATEAKSAEKEREAVEDVRALGADIRLIAERPQTSKELPADEDKNIERHVDEALTMRPSVFEVDSDAESAYNKMIVGDYYQAIVANRSSRMKCLEVFSSFQVYSTAVSIRAAEELLSKLEREGVAVDGRMRTALAGAKRSFIEGTPRAREEALENLEALVTKTYETFVSRSEDEEAELRALLADYEAFGTRIEEPRKYLEIAVQAKSASDMAEYSRLLRNARASAENAKAERTREIDSSYHLVKASATAAAAAGADVTKAQSDLGEAKRAMKSGSFKEAVDLLLAVERAADAAHLEQMRMQKDLEARQRENIRSTVTVCEPILLEASSYGMNVQEGLVLVSNAKTALSRNDLVYAAKFSVRVKEIAEGLEKNLQKARIDRGIAKHIEDAKCGKCGKKSLYQYPNNVERCHECGHTFTTAGEGVRGEDQQPSRQVAQAPPTSPPEQQAQKPEEKKKRRLLRW